MYMKPEGIRKVGRWYTTWKDEVRKDARMLGTRIWWATAMNQEEWREFLIQAKTLCELYS
jgi:hypothetical protein